ncbi:MULTISPECIES: hypothetical protein [Alteribacter]|uniref:Uncharacterized protein n=1 Tax=Alteribacter keqinensis TaxID=2483800 RepID=A0A3M7TXZ5_9BACI|nr:MULTISPECIES: hypothetical protein [Alteribacter]MBM7096306.1 hypothetical protein [Alteribacter salitolerans]RNA70468.1 hypothetical protein EBO34_11260 [Alteribacter keqinensis]
MKQPVTHTYYKVQKVVNSIEQKTVEHERTITMDKEKVTTAHREFKFENVFDVSYRSIQGEEGLMYLHTSQGVYSYMVKDDPADFIAAFKELDKQ